MKRILKMRQRNILEGLVFVLPLIIGLAVFFIFPLFISIKLSFGKVINIKGFQIVWTGIENYTRAFVVDVEFIPMFIKVIEQMALKAPLIIVFSLLLAMFINKDIRMRGFFRTAFFLPFLFGTGYVMNQLLGLGVNEQVAVQTSEASAGGMFAVTEILSYLGPGVAALFESFFGTIVVVLWSCGLQMLLFLSALQSISRSLYEAAKVDGATEWENFWKITLPMISPILLLNIVYTVISSFTDITNPVLAYIKLNAFELFDFEYAAAVGWIYFLFIILLVLILFFMLRKSTSSFELKAGN